MNEMAPGNDFDRVEIYKRSEIRIVVLPPVSALSSYRAKYDIQAMGEQSYTPIAGIIAGAFATEREAEEAALNAAKQAIDRRFAARVE